MKNAMQGKVCLVTGGNAGIGLETARGLARSGATVVIAARDQTRGSRAVADVAATTANPNVSLLPLDLASLKSIRAAASEFSRAHARLDVLVNNAGLIHSDRRTTEDGFEAMFGINHLGHFELTRLLLDRITASVPARIVNVASHAHRTSAGLNFDDLMVERRPFNGRKVYGDSKLANILFTKELAQRLRGTGIVTHALHPGVVRSGFARDGDAKGPIAWVFKYLAPFLLTAAEGAATSLHVALSEDAGSSSGEYWARSARAQPRPAALDAAAAKRLWEASEALIDAAGAGP